MSREEIYFYFIWKQVVMHWKQWCAGKSTIIATILVNQEKKVTKLSIYHIRLSLLGRMLRNSWLGFDCLPIKFRGSYGAPGHRFPLGEAFSYWVVLFYSYVFNLLCFAPWSLIILILITTMSNYLLLIFHSGSLFGPTLSMDDNLSSVLHVTMQYEIQTQTVVSESYTTFVFTAFWIRYMFLCL